MPLPSLSSPFTNLNVALKKQFASSPQFNTLPPKPGQPVMPSFATPAPVGGSVALGPSRPVLPEVKTQPVASSTTPPPTSATPPPSGGGAPALPNSLYSGLTSTLGNISTLLGNLKSPQTPTSDQGSTQSPVLPQVSPEAKSAQDLATKAYEKSLEISPEELSTQEDLNKLIESTKAGYLATSGQTIPMEFITGQLKSIENRATGLAEPLQQKLARLQAARTSSLESSKFALERADKSVTAEKSLQAPTEVAAGSSITKYNASTGKYENVFTAPKTYTPSEQYGTGPIGEYNYYSAQEKLAGRTPMSWNEYQTLDANRKRSVTNIGVGTGGTVTPDAQGWITAINNGKAKLSDVPAALKTVVAGNLGSAPSSYQTEHATRTISSVDDLLKSAKDNPAIFGRSADVPIPSWLRSDAFRNFSAQLDTLKSNIAFSELTAMREASKTGGALGQISDKEEQLLSSALGALKMDQSPQNVVTQLQNIRDSINRWQQAVNGQTPVAGASSGNSPQQMQLPNGTVVTRQADGSYQ